MDSFCNRKLYYTSSWGNAVQFYTGTGQNGNRRGIDISTTTTLNKGEVIKILVGQQGGINSWSQSGGGTFVVRDIKTPIIVVGGGGSGGQLGSLGGYLSGPYSDASSSTNGNGGIASVNGSNVTLLTNVCSGGNGGSFAYQNSGGGLTGNEIKDAESITPGLAFINGGLGGNSEVESVGGGGSARGGFGVAGGNYTINTMTINGYNSSGQGSVTITLN